MVSATKVTSNSCVKYQYVEYGNGWGISGQNRYKQKINGSEYKIDRLQRICVAQKPETLAVDCND